MGLPAPKGPRPQKGLDFGRKTALIIGSRGGTGRAREGRVSPDQGVGSPLRCGRCGSASVRRRDDASVCAGCGTITRHATLVKPSAADVRYLLEIRDRQDRPLWIDSLEVLASAQRDIDSALRSPPTASFKWLADAAHGRGEITDPLTLAALRKILAKLESYSCFVLQPHVAQAVRRLHEIFPWAAKVVVRPAGQN